MPQQPGTVTITLKKSTVSVLRKAKGGDTWDGFLLDLVKIKKQGARVECMICGRVLETENVYESPSILAEKNGWTEIAVKGRLNAIGFACPACLLVLEAKDVQESDYRNGEKRRYT